MFEILSLIICCLFVPMLGLAADVREVNIDQLHQDVVNMKAVITTLNQTVATLEGQLKTASALAAQAAANPCPAPVAFTAHLSKSIVNIPKHQHVAFDHIITNIGGAYSSSTGHFVAPVFGIYLFTITATNTPGYSASLTLMKNGASMAVTLAHGGSATPNQWETSTISATLVLNTGDEVWAQNEGQFSPTENLDGYNYSSFSGFLINEI